MQRRSLLTDQARGARGVAESALEASGWPWSRKLSRWLDALMLVEERGA